MPSEENYSLIIDLIVIAISIVLVILGKSFREKKSSKGISASSNETSTGTTLIIIGTLLLLTQAIKIATYF